MFFAPMSELYGRKVIYVSTLLVGLLFIIPGAVAKNIGTLLVARAIDGIGFRCVTISFLNIHKIDKKRSAPMTIVGGTLADLWRNEERGVPMAAFSAAPFIGPAIGE